MSRQRNTVNVDVADLKSIRSAIEFYAERKRLVLAAEKDVAENTATGIRNTHLPQMLAILRVYPPRRLGMKMRWKSPKQKIAYFATGGFGGGIPYKRTGRLAAGWKSVVRVEVVAQRVRLVVRTWNDAISPWNNKPYVQFVQGNFGSGQSRWSVSRYVAPIQPFHADRGWHPAYKDIEFFYGRIRQYAAENYARRYEQIFSGQ